LVGVVANQGSIFEGAWLALCGVAHREAPAGSGVSNARPLTAGREPTTTATAKPAEPEFANDTLRSGFPSNRQPLPAACGKIGVDGGHRFSGQKDRHARPGWVHVVVPTRRRDR
jgi:hypothetical protein